ncbi:MAG: hypothetical protein Q8P31_00655 [Bacillota bacterium]|nr:hypothetical protein [Bacillota bacterium]
MLSAVAALLWPAPLGPDLDPQAVADSRERLAAIGAALERSLDHGPEVRLSIHQEELGVLAADLAGEKDGTGVTLRVRPETVSVGFRIPTPVGLTAHIRLVIQPSLLDGRLFLGLRGVRIGLLPIPPAWFVSIQAGDGGSGWLFSRGTPGYALPGRLLHEGIAWEISDLWCIDGWVEVVLTRVVTAGDR